VSGGDAFDLSRFAPPPGMVGATKPRREAKRLVGFVKIPWSWANALASDDVGGKVWAVACHILYETWREKGRPIKVPNGMLARCGVSRSAKVRALRKLEELGLVSIEWRPHKSPIVTIRGESSVESERRT
jgi:hypothetical protein